MLEFRIFVQKIEVRKGNLVVPCNVIVSCCCLVHRCVLEFNIVPRCSSSKVWVIADNGRDLSLARTRRCVGKDLVREHADRTIQVIL